MAGFLPFLFYDVLFSIFSFDNHFYMGRSFITCMDQTHYWLGYKTFEN